MRMAQNREAWLRVMETYALQWVEYVVTYVHDNNKRTILLYKLSLQYNYVRTPDV